MKRSTESLEDLQATNAEVKRLLLAALSERPELSLRKLATAARMDQGSLSKALSDDPEGNRGIPLHALRRIADALGVPIERLIPGASPARDVPLVGRIAATFGRLFDVGAQESVGAVEAPRRAFPQGTVAMRVRGDSMVGAGILDGDLVFVRPATTARDGDIVACTNNGNGGDETTLKRLRRRLPPPGVAAPEEWWLCPENATHEPVRLRPGEAWIQGVVICSLREYEGGG